MKKGIVIIILGLCLIMNASYIQAKAFVAQVLIANAFKQQLETGVPKKPWPWADTKVIAKLSAKTNTKEFNSYVLYDASMRNLAFGPSQMLNTGALNTTNSYGNSVIVGHRDTHFAYLEHLNIDDKITVSDFSGQSNYKITEIVVVEETNISVLKETEQKMLTLITCYPFNDISPEPTQRYVVRAVKLT